MKRSEVVKIIKNFLKDYEDSGFADEREDDASALLSNLENIGMLPPGQRNVTHEWDPECEKV